MHSQPSGSDLPLHERSFTLPIVSDFSEAMPGLRQCHDEHQIVHAGKAFLQISIPLQKLAERLLCSFTTGVDALARGEMCLQEDELLHGKNLARLQLERARERVAAALQAKAFAEDPSGTRVGAFVEL